MPCDSHRVVLDNLSQIGCEGDEMTVRDVGGVFTDVVLDRMLFIPTMAPKTT
jgi:hypothetical protein